MTKTKQESIEHLVTVIGARTADDCNGFADNEHFKSAVDYLRGWYEEELRDFALEIKEEIKKQLDHVEVVPHNPSMVKEAKIMHKMIVHMYQIPVDQALSERLKKGGE